MLSSLWYLGFFWILTWLRAFYIYWQQRHNLQNLKQNRADRARHQSAEKNVYNSRRSANVYYWNVGWVFRRFQRKMLWLLVLLVCLDTSHAQSIQSEHQFREGMDDIKILEQLDVDRVYTALTQDNVVEIANIRERVRIFNQSTFILHICKSVASLYI